MKINIRKILIIIAVLAGLFIIYNLLFIKTVSYSIGGINIPAKYNVITGKARPIIDYKGSAPKKIIVDMKADKIGLDSKDVTAAQFRWALFEEWARTQPQYKGWESDPEIFRKASEEYKRKMPSSVEVIK